MTDVIHLKAEVVHVLACPLCGHWPSLHEQGTSAGCMNPECGLYGNWIELALWQQRPGEEKLQRDLNLAVEAVVKLDPDNLGSFRWYLMDEYADWRALVYLQGEVERLIGVVRGKEGEIEKLIDLVKEAQSERDRLQFDVSAAESQLKQARANIAEFEKPCQWHESDDHEWLADCGLSWYFEEGSPEENCLKFCPKCGHPAEHHYFVATEEE